MIFIDFVPVPKLPECWDHQFLFSQCAGFIL